MVSILEHQNVSGFMLKEVYFKEKKYLAKYEFGLLG